MYEAEAEVFKALGDPVRLRILALLRVRETCVCELVQLLPVSQPAVSQHLRKLRQAGLVQERRHKYWTYYALSEQMPADVRAAIERLPRAVQDENWLSEHQMGPVCSVPPLSDQRPAVE